MRRLHCLRSIRIRNLFGHQPLCLVQPRLQRLVVLTLFSFQFLTIINTVSPARDDGDGDEFLARTVPNVLDSSGSKTLWTRERKGTLHTIC